jgi:single-stranded DNA-binding protein
MNRRKKMYQEVKLVGYLGKDPTIHHTRTGGKVANVSVAVKKTSVYRMNSKTEKRPAWFSIEAWGELADEIQALYKSRRLVKGSKVLVLGELRYDPDTGGPSAFFRRNGRPGASFVLRAYQIVALSEEEPSEDDLPEQPDVPVESNQGRADAQVASMDSSAEPGDDEIPF